MSENIVRVSSQWRIRILLLAAGIVLSGIMLLGIERALYYLYGPRHSGGYGGDYEGKFFRFDERLGYVPRSSGTMHAIKKIGDRVIYDVLYSIDDRGRRVVPLGAAGREKYLLFFGCSFTFGEGVNDTETLPYYVARPARAYRPYNYGYVGYGPQQMLARLEQGELRKEVGEKEGALIYLFLGEHVNRAIGSTVVTGVWGYDMPYYDLDGEGRLVRQGSFRSRRPWRAFAARTLMKTGYGMYLRAHGDFPRIAARHLDLTCRIIEEARSRYRQQFGNDDFYVVFYPGSYPAATLIGCLRKEGVRCIDYHDREELSGPGNILPVDGHPNAAGYRLLASMLARDLPFLAETGEAGIQGK